MSILRIGNDLVCLHTAPDKSKDQRFINRVLTDSEQHLLQQICDKHFLLWAIWAIKEATFKAYQQLNEQAFFSPKTIEVSFEKDGFFGELSLEKKVVRTRLQGFSRLTDEVFRFELGLENNCIHSLVVDSPTDFSGISYHVGKITGDMSYTSQSIKAKKLALSFAKRRGVIADEIRREKLASHKKSPPRFYKAGVKLSVPLSLSHDGSFIAVCMQNRNA